jgi:predicted  nucleic acid-binding Zn-ribbon protein
MLPVLESLLVLQDRDIKLRQTLKDLELVPQEEKSISDKLKFQMSEFEALKLRTNQIESERKDLDNQVLSKKTNISKYKTQQFETRNNEQFQALNVEIERAEKAIVELEDKELELMEKYEAAQKDVAAESIRVKEFEKAAQGRKNDLAAKKLALEESKKRLESDVVELAAKIDTVELGKYRRLLQSKGDIAIVPVEHGSNCGGCHMKLTQQTILNAKSGQRPATCEDCGRMLYWTVDSTLAS